jgi:single-strand DNA-binding protein
VAWGKTAEFVAKYLRKGTKIAINGSLRSRTWEQDGKTHYATEIEVSEHEFMESKASGGASDAGRYVGTTPEDLAGLDLPF